MEEVRELEGATAFDEQRVRRDVAKECIYGVDLNGMAVELAKLSMWLETLAADQPLAFLDHHLKTGNSLIGSDVTEVLSSDTEGNSGQLTLQQALARVRQDTLEHVMDRMQELLEIDNETLEDVRSMEAIYDEVRSDPFYQRLFELTNVYTAERFDLEVPEDAYERMARAINNENKWANIRNEDWFETAQSISDEQTVFHWELEYPDAFFNEDGEQQEDAGFDAVIGNPPYVSNWELAESNEDLPELLENLYPEATGGHWDLFIPFSYRAANLTKDAGYHSFITPNSLATEKYGKNIREIYINNYSLLKLVSFGDHQVFEGVDRQCMIYMISPGNAEDDNECEIYAFESNQFVHQYTIDPQRFLSYSNSTFRIEVTRQDMTIKDKIESESVLLGELCCVNPGVVAHSASDSDLDFKKDDVISKEGGENKRKYISGSNISRHNVRWEGEYMEYYTYQEHFHRPKFPALFENPKIMFSRISGSNNMIKSCYDPRGYYTNHIVIHAVPWDDEIREHQSGVDYEIKPDSEALVNRQTASS